MKYLQKFNEGIFGFGKKKPKDETNKTSGAELVSLPDKSIYPDKPTPEPTPEPTPKKYEAKPIDSDGINELLIRFSSFKKVIKDKFNSVFDINMFIIEKISNMICDQYSLFARKGNLISNFSQFYDSMDVLIISREGTKDCTEFYIDNDWYVFRIFVMKPYQSINNICLSVKVHKTYLNAFLNRVISKDPWGDSQYQDRTVVNRYTPPSTVDKYVPPPKKDTITEMKELMKKIKNKKMNK